MIRIRSKNVLLVAPDNFSVELLPQNKQFRHVAAINNIFPAIHESKPNVVIFDYDHLTKDIEKILRRIHTNPAYHKMKVYCYKSKAHTQTDALLKALGADQVFYPEDFKESVKGKSMSTVLSGIFEAPLLNLLAKTSH